MLAAVLRDFDDMVLEDVPVAEPGPGEVVVRIRSCGFCATDYKAIRGIRRNVVFPAILGHEPAGVVHAIGDIGKGDTAEHFREGDEVICQPSGYCGLCRHCRAGDTHYCQQAFTTGGIGLLCVMVARAAGTGRLIAIDPSEHARRGAQRLGVTHTIDLRRRGTRWNVFGITTHETFELEGGRTHFLEGRMDASFGTTPLAMLEAIRLMETGLVDPEKIISHRFPLSQIHQAVETMASADRGKVIVNP